ncbi:arsenic metallochaperone ArsD family protein [Paenibacillus sp. GCM10012306]|uniref:arsenic metallochaperone ArsD family protein n=1 Tax=Paenibacillus sp. GCM10012306 TaxID=3317342 RepID=UPI00361FFC6B
MVKIEVFESGGCCSTGVTNPEEKRASIRFAVAISQLSQAGFDVSGYNLLSDTTKFEENEAVKEVLASDPSSLPVTLLNGVVVKTRSLPTNEELSAWTTMSLERLEGKGECI